MNSKELDIKPGMKIKFDGPWWNNKDIHYTVVEASWYNKEKESTAVQLKLEEIDHITVISRNGIKIV